jgi:hypothetical protein
MNKYWILFSTGLLLLACSVDYDIGQSNIMEQNRLVVNSLLNPHQPTSVYFYKTERVDTGYRFSTVRDVKVVLQEDGKALFDGICSDTVLHLDYHPKAGAYYTIEVSYPGLETVSAETFVPNSITCKAKMIMEYRSDWDKWLADLSEFKLPTGSQASLWITVYTCHENGFVSQYHDIYANNLLIDNVNKQTGMPVMNPVVGSIYYDAFLRIKNGNLPNLDKLVFTPAHAYHYGSIIPNSPEKQINVKLIAAGREYDRYCHTLYEQKSMIFYEDDISAIVFQPIQVYSNIKNGLGIFAGINETNYYFDLPDE